jgi:hypothetical protein
MTGTPLVEVSTTGQVFAAKVVHYAEDAGAANPASTRPLSALDLAIYRALVLTHHLAQFQIYKDQRGILAVQCVASASLNVASGQHVRFFVLG